MVTQAVQSAVPKKNVRLIHEIRQHNVRASVWKEATERGPKYSITFSRAYRNNRGEWDESTSFSFGDLMNLAKVASDTHSAIVNAISLEHAARDTL
jgi:hypothetical protein